MTKKAFQQLKLTRLGLFIALFLGSISIISAAPSEFYKLSQEGPLPIGGNVGRFKISPDGSYNVYQAGQEVAEIRQLYAVPADLSREPVKVSALPRPTHNIQDFKISPDNTHVVYSAEQDTRELYELYSARMDGGTPPIKISGEMVENGGLADHFAFFEFTPDGSRVVYRAVQETEGVNELYSVPVDGSEPPVKLNGPLPDGGITSSFAINPDGQHVVYISDQETDNVFELFRVPLAGGVAPVKLSGTLVSDGGVSAFNISPDSGRVVFLADKDTNNVRELYMVPLDGSAAPIKLNDTLTAGGEVGFGTNYFISPNSQRVVYLADQDTNDINELYSVPIGGGTVTKLNPALPSGGEVSWVWEPQISADSSRVVYLADQVTPGLEEIFSVPIAGGTATKLNGTLVANFLHDFAISPDSTRVVYRARQDSATIYELYSVPLAGGPQKKLNAPLPAGHNTNGFQISPGSNIVVYSASASGGDNNQLYRVPLLGGDVSMVNGPLPPGGRAVRFDISPDNGRVVFIADQETLNVDELFQTSLAAPGPVDKINGQLAIGADLWDYEITNDSQFVLYLADHRRLYGNDLYRVRLDGSDVPKALSAVLPGAFRVDDMEPTADSKWVLFTVSQQLKPDFLYSMPILGGVPKKLNMTALAQARIHYFRLSDDSKYAVYRAEEDTSSVWEAYSAKVDGSGVQTKLNGTLVSGGEVDRLQISPDNTRVIYAADQVAVDVVNLYSVPIGGGTAKMISAPLGPGREIDNNNFAISPDGVWVAYVADHDTDDVFELYLVPADGSAAPVKVNDPLVMGGNVDRYSFSPTSNALVYRADQEVKERYELYYVSLPGPGAPVKLNAPLGSRDVSSYEFNPDSTFLAYVASTGFAPDSATSEVDLRAEGADELFSVPLPDGEAIKLDQALNPGERIGNLEFSPDGSYLIFGVYSGTLPDSTAQIGSSMLFSVRPDGSERPRQISHPAAEGDYIDRFWITSDSARVIYELSYKEWFYELYTARIDGQGLPGKTTIPLVEGGRVQRSRLSPDDGRLVYQADQDIEAVDELYATTLPEPQARLYLPLAVDQ